ANVWRGLEPSAPTNQIDQCGPPFDSNASVPPSGDQDGLTFWFGPWKTSREPEPSTSTTWSPVVVASAIRAPSGDHTGPATSQEGIVTGPTSCRSCAPSESET